MHSFSLHEKKQHGTLDFPVAYYDIIPKHPHYVMPFHWHQEWELIHIRKGEVVLHADDCEYNAKEGDVLLFREGMLHGSPPPEDVEYDCLVFDFQRLFQKNELLKTHLRSIYHMEYLPNIYYPREENSDIYSFVVELMEAQRRHQQCSSDVKYLELVTVSSLSYLFLRILQNKHYITNSKNVPGFAQRINQIKSVLEYIEHNYQDKITLDALATVANMNPRYLCRVFKQITSLSPMDYVIYLRIEQACALLTTTTWPVIEIALDCGFNDCSYFTKVFKQKKGMTPREYRKRE